MNRDHGHGGIKAAAKKFGISPGSIRKWMKQTGAAAAAETGAPRIALRPRSEQIRTTKVLERMVELGQKTVTLQHQLAEKQARGGALKKQM